MNAIKREQETQFQLTKFQDPSQNIARQAYLNLVTEFGDLIIENKIDNIIQRLLFQDCQIFFYGPTEPAVVYKLDAEGLKDMYSNKKIIEKIVRETHIDLAKNTASQISSCQVLHREDGETKSEGLFEIFSIANNKIVKYRACFGPLVLDKDLRDPLAPNRKDIMLAKVKEINYALAGYPNLEKVASYLLDSTEYKIWSWDKHKCFILRKANFVSEFKSLEENFVIKTIVPYELYTDGDFVVGTYVYYIEGNALFPRQKFAWLATSIYTFDHNLDLIKIMQQGEMYLEEEVIIPFEKITKERLAKQTDDIFTTFASNPSKLDILYTDLIHPTCQVSRIGPEDFGELGSFQKLYDLDKFIMNVPENAIRWIKAVDIFVDFNDPAYEVVTAVLCSEGLSDNDRKKPEPMHSNAISFSRIAFENGKAVKFVEFFAAIREPTLSSFDDKSFSAKNIIPQSNIK